METDPIELESRAQITADQFGGIVPYIETFHLASIAYSAARSIESFELYDNLLLESADADRLVSSVQEGVIHAAAVSRYFWPSPMGKKSEPEFNRMKTLRGDKLRTAFSIDSSSPLHNRDLRNAWEHFDERIDKYFLEVTAGEFFPDPLVGSHTHADSSFQHFLKLLDTEAHCLVLLGVKYFYEEIRSAVHDVLVKSHEFLQAGSRLPQ